MIFVEQVPGRAGDSRATLMSRVFPFGPFLRSDSMFKMATKANKSSEPLPTDLAPPSDSEHSEQPLLPDTLYQPYSGKPGLREPPYKPYAEEPVHESPYEPYKGI